MQLPAGPKERQHLLVHRHFFAGPRIAASPRGALLHREGAETTQLYAIAARQCGNDRHDQLSILLPQMGLSARSSAMSSDLVTLASSPHLRTPRCQADGLPAGDDADALPGLPVVGDAGEPPAQLDRGRELAALLEHGADRSSIRLGDDEHRWSMGTCPGGGQPLLIGRPQRVRLRD
jgi:hypothetical protein